ncbi:hypothetical protein C8F01DRAFT_1175952 [Mycena amicta]|nr:hypothetical protein C8F01DRAFT_1175952 [Mycena amicta]
MFPPIQAALHQNLGLANEFPPVTARGYLTFGTKWEVPTNPPKARPSKPRPLPTTANICGGMAQPLYYPSKYFFCPISNTAAVSLLRDLAPEEPGNILLLGCGDPRGILYTARIANIARNARYH